MICFMAMVSMIVAPQRQIALVRIRPHGRGPFKIGVVSDEGKQPVIGDVEGGELGRLPFLFQLFLGAPLTLTLTSFFFRVALCGRFAALGSYHHCL